MYYLDSTGRSSKDSLGYWLSQEAAAEQAQLRVKTGYFTLNGLGALKSSIDHLVQSDFPISIALGANEKATIKADVDSLFTLIGAPRPKAKLCVISCSGGLFHPKVIHLTRTDGSELAYVGSANLTPGGVNGTNIEAGVLVDSRKGDPISILQEIAASVDHWFNGTAAPGVTQIRGPISTQQLVDDGVLGVVAPSINNGTGNSGGPSIAGKIQLKPLISFPSLAPSQASQATIHTGAGTVQPVSGVQPGTGGLEILVAEIGKGVRWKQANFPYAMMQNYFGVNPVANELIEFYPVAANGVPAAPVVTQVVHVKSHNYRVELGSVSGIPYPLNGPPIGVFRRIGVKKFRYRVFFPGDTGYAALTVGLAKTYSGPSRQLKRIVINSGALNIIWNACPV